MKIKRQLPLSRFSPGRWVVIGQNLIWCEIEWIPEPLGSFSEYGLEKVVPRRVGSSLPVWTRWSGFQRWVLLPISRDEVTIKKLSVLGIRHKFVSCGLRVLAAGTKTSCKGSTTYLPSLASDPDVPFCGMSVALCAIGFPVRKERAPRT